MSSTISQAIAFTYQSVSTPQSQLQSQASSLVSSIVSQTSSLNSVTDPNSQTYIAQGAVQALKQVSSVQAALTPDTLSDIETSVA